MYALEIEGVLHYLLCVFISKAQFILHPNRRRKLNYLGSFRDFDLSKNVICCIINGFHFQITLYCIQLEMSNHKKTSPVIVNPFSTYLYSVYCQEISKEPYTTQSRLPVGS